MSRMTAAQVISLGEYLNTDFDPTSLTVSQLLGVLNYHNINYPTPYSKPKLIQLFNDELKSKATKWRKERIKKENSIASDEGIIDGATGEPIRKVVNFESCWYFPNAMQEPIPRRSSRRLSRMPVEEDKPAPESLPEPVCISIFSNDPRDSSVTSRSVEDHLLNQFSVDTRARFQRSRKPWQKTASQRKSCHLGKWDETRKL